MNTLTASCSCGSVEIEAVGTPIVGIICYCDDCQEGSRQIGALPHALPIQDADGGTACIAYRKDRVRCTRGAALLKSYKIRESSVTNRVVATCCNSAMLLNFDDGKHWVDVYRSRIKGEPPPVQMRICTRFKPGGVDDSGGVPSYPGYPIGFLARLLGAWIGMLFRG